MPFRHAESGAERVGFSRCEPGAENQRLKPFGIPLICRHRWSDAL